MRIGSNPQKTEKVLTVKTSHRIVVVVYIPNNRGFYKNAFSVLKLCLESLFQTINDYAAITVVNNGSSKTVSEFLVDLHKHHRIETLIHHCNNIGKIDAQIGAARGSREKIITLSDSDILFSKGWQENVEMIFNNFPNVGSVSPIPVREGYNYGTSPVLKYIIFKKIKFKFKSIPENFDSYNKYMESINWDKEMNKDAKWPVVENNNVQAIIGSGHQVLTIDRSILFTTTPLDPSYTLVGNNSELNYVDIPIEKSGKLRLSTYNNYAFHMGNEVENWMLVESEKNLSATKSTSGILKITNEKKAKNTFKFKNVYLLKKKIYKKLFKWIYSCN